MEGRAFILGRNGFYNKIIEILKKNNIFQIYFVFLFKNESEEEMKNCLENLIKKGDQKDLEYFMDNNHIIYINENIFHDKEKKEKLLFYLSHKMLKNFYCLKNFDSQDNKKVNENPIEEKNENKIENSINIDSKIGNSLRVNKINPFFSRFKNYIVNSLYFRDENNFMENKNFYDDKSEILERLKYLKLFQNYSKGKFGDENNARFNCEIL